MPRARHAGQSAHPELWSGLLGAWVPGLGFSGERIPDVSGRGHDATFTGVTTAGWVGSSDRRFSRVLRLDGDSDYLPTGDLNYNGGTWAPHSVALWARRKSPLTFGGVYNHNSVSGNDVVLFTYDDGDFAYGDSSLGAGNWIRADTNTWTDTAAFHHLVIVARSNTVTDLYFDGLLLTTFTRTTDQNDGIREFDIGLYRRNSLTNTFDGDIASCMLYSRNLPPSEVFALYRDPLGMFRRRGFVSTPTAEAAAAAATGRIMSSLAWRGGLAGDGGVAGIGGGLAG